METLLVIVAKLSNKLHNIEIWGSPNVCRIDYKKLKLLRQIIEGYFNMFKLLMTKAENFNDLND